MEMFDKELWEDFEEIGVHDGVDYDKIAMAIVKAMHVKEREQENADIAYEPNGMQKFIFGVSIVAALVCAYRAFFVLSFPGAASIKMLLAGIGAVILGLSFALDDGEKSIADTKNTMMTLLAVVALVASLL